LTAHVECTNGGASRNGSVRVGSALITLLTLVSLSDAITTEGTGTGGCAGGGSVDASIALFVGIDHAVTAGVAFAVESASVREGVGVGSTIITVLVSLFDSVTAIFLAARASIIINIVAVITFLTSIHNTVAAVGISAVESASIGLGVTSVDSGVALFTAKVVNNIVTAEVQLTIHTASVRASVAVAIVNSCGEFDGVSVIASFIDIDLSVSASEGAVSEAQPGINTARIAVLIGVDNVVTARGRSARSHRVPRTTEWVGGCGAAKGVGSSVVASLVEVDSSVSTVP